MQMHIAMKLPTTVGRIIRDISFSFANRQITREAMLANKNPSSIRDMDHRIYRLSASSLLLK